MFAIFFLSSPRTTTQCCLRIPPTLTVTPRPSWSPRGTSSAARRTRRNEDDSGLFPDGVCVTTGNITKAVILNKRGCSQSDVMCLIQICIIFICVYDNKHHLPGSIIVANYPKWMKKFAYYWCSTGRFEDSVV